jgi:hypothetical protein
MFHSFIQDIHHKIQSNNLVNRSYKKCKKTRIEIHDNWRKDWMRRDLQSCFQTFKSCFSIMIPLFPSLSKFATLFHKNKSSFYSARNGSKLGSSSPPANFPEQITKTHQQSLPPANFSDNILVFSIFFHYKLSLILRFLHLNYDKKHL